MSRGPDPFNDPFFGDPFSHMQSMMSRMDQMMGSFGGGFFNDPFFSGGSGQPAAYQQQPRLPPARIEEVHDDDVAGRRTTPSHVEEPDEDPYFRQMSSQQPTSQQQQQMGNTIRVTRPTLNNANSFGTGGFGFGGPSTTYAYSSSSFISNNNGVTYQKSTQARMGPGGVKEIQQTERDGRTGKESMSISRALGDKERTTVRTRDASGQEAQKEKLRGIQQEEIHRFDDEWRRAAESSLPQPPSFRLGAGQQQQQQQRPLALPSSGMSGPAYDSSSRPHGGSTQYYRGHYNQMDGNDSGTDFGRSRRRYG